ncbi:MAG: lytic transglycosylase domain-containing protein, partial [Dongiaceae bacterium]
MPRTIPALFSIFLALLPLATAAEPLLTTGDVAIYKQAFQLVDQEKWVEARALAGRAENPLPAKFIQWLDLIRPGPGRSFDEITGFVRTSPDWPGQISLQEQGERAMPPNLGTEEVLAWFADREPATIEGAMMLAQALIAKGLTQQAIDMVRRAWAQLPVSTIAEGPFLAAYAQFLQPVDHIARLDRLPWAGETAAAERMISLV